MPASAQLVVEEKQNHAREHDNIAAHQPKPTKPTATPSFLVWNHLNQQTKASRDQNGLEAQRPVQVAARIRKVCACIVSLLLPVQELLGQQVFYRKTKIWSPQSSTTHRNYISAGASCYKQKVKI